MKPRRLYRTAVITSVLWVGCFGLALVVIFHGGAR